jgi:hypothetical protein
MMRFQTSQIAHPPTLSSIFPAFEQFAFRLMFGPLTTFLRYITFAQVSKFNPTCRKNRSTQIDFSNFLSVLATKFLSSLVIRSLILRTSEGTIDTEAHAGLEFYFWTTVNQDHFPSPSRLSSLSQLQLVLTWPLSHPHNHEKVLTSPVDAMRLPFLTQLVLQISTDDYIDSQTWGQDFCKASSIEMGVCAGLCATLVS